MLVMVEESGKSISLAEVIHSFQYITDRKHAEAQFWDTFSDMIDKFGRMFEVFQRRLSETFPPEDRQFVARLEHLKDQATKAQHETDFTYMLTLLIQSIFEVTLSKIDTLEPVQIKEFTENEKMLRQLYDEAFKVCMDKYIKRHESC